MSLSEEIVHAVRQRQNQGLPEKIRGKVNLHIIDTIGISLAAYRGAPVALNAINGDFGWSFRWHGESNRK